MQKPTLSMLSPSATQLQASMARNFHELQIELDQVERREIGRISVVIAQASITRVVRFDDAGAGSSSTHSCVYHEVTDAQYPRFSIRPMGIMFRMAGAMGLKGLDFADQPAFAKQYFLIATEPLRAQAILHRKVRDWLLARPGLNVEAGGTGVMVFHAGGVLRPRELDVFARDAAELLDLLDRSLHMAIAKLDPPTELDELRAFAKLLPAHMGRSAERELLARRVTQADVDTFVNQARPRKIPKNIAYFYDMSFGIAIWGGFFLVSAAVMGYGGFVMRQWGAFLMVTVFSLVGATMLYFGVPRFLREKRLLQWGEPAVGRIVDFESTGNSENGGDVHLVGVRFEAGGWSGRVECRAVGKTAKRIGTEEKTTRILYDPHHPEHALLIDALVNWRGT